MDYKINLITFLNQEFDDKYLNDLLCSLYCARQEVKDYGKRLIDDKKEVDVAEQELNKAIEEENFEKIPSLKDTFEKLAKDYRERLETHYEYQQSYQKIYDEIEELIDYDEAKIRTGLICKDFDEKTLATFKVCCNFLGSLLRFRLITIGKAESEKYEPVTSMVWRVTQKEVARFMSSNIVQKRQLGFDKMSDKAAYNYILYLLSDLDFYMDDQYTNWKTEDIDVYDNDYENKLNYRELKNVYEELSNYSYGGLSSWFNQNFKREFLAKKFYALSEARKYLKNSEESFNKAEKAFSQASDELNNALNENIFENVKFLKNKLDESKQNLNLAQKNYLKGKREVDSAFYRVSEIIDFDEQKFSDLDFKKDILYSAYDTYKICFKLISSMVKIFRIKQLGTKSQYYSQITSKIWRIARKKIINSISSNQMGKKHLGLGEMNDRSAKKYLSKLLASIDYGYKSPELREWKQKEVYIYGWRSCNFGKKLLSLSKLDEEKEEDLDDILKDIETYISNVTESKLSEFFRDWDLQEAISEIEILMDGHHLDFDLYEARGSDDLAYFVVNSESFIYSLRFSLGSHGAVGIIEALDCLEGCDHPSDFMMFDF